MNPIDLLKDEHGQIERELIELETIAEDELINLPNFVHTFRKLCEMWNSHEKKEEKIFPFLEENEILIPVEKMLCDHKKLKNHRQVITSAINSGSEFELKKVLNTHVQEIIKKMREHINYEDEILYVITLEKLDIKEIEKLWKSLQ